MALTLGPRTQLRSMAKLIFSSYMAIGFRVYFSTFSLTFDTSLVMTFVPDGPAPPVQTKTSVLNVLFSTLIIIDSYFIFCVEKSRTVLKNLKETIQALERIAQTENMKKKSKRDPLWNIKKSEVLTWGRKPLGGQLRSQTVSRNRYNSRWSSQGTLISLNSAEKKKHYSKPVISISFFT